MYLKKIEVQGFKSFANKINFEFHNGITAIVGPNGSGKSNVSDAVRWVLGEQSAKQLRGGNMQDVIFAGTELKKPQGFAYVAITLDNSDKILPIEYDEVTVSRRLYRSGESEYMINSAACRLKDIQELFYDTGIGKDGYSIIGQGQVERILNGKPEEKRELFDEAAGITKFKRRKLLAQKKLDNESANLLRINDILSELEKQVGPLERQSEKAKQYLKLRDELKSLDVNMFLSESENLRENLRLVSEREAIVSDELEESREKYDELKSGYEDEEQRLSELDSLIRDDRENEFNKSIRLKDIGGQTEVLREQINTEKNNEEHISRRIVAVDDEILKRENQLSEYNESRLSYDSELENVQGRLDLAMSELEANDERLMLLDRSIEESKRELIAGINQRAELSNRLQHFNTLLEQLDIRRSELNSKLLKIRSDELGIRQRVEEEQKNLDELNKRLADSEAELTDKNSGIERMREERRRKQSLLSSTQTDYQSSYARLESLKNIAERYDGYGNSIKRVMETKGRIRGIHGVVADLISTERQYELAVETALGGRLQNIVTDSEDTAKQLIEYLKKNKFGRATFLPVSSAGERGDFKPGAVMKEKGVIELASSLVKNEEIYDNLVKSLLGRIIVVDNIDNAIAIEKKYGYEYRIVTLDGESLSPGGSISGGAFKNSGNLLARRREIEELESEVDRLFKRYSAIENELSSELEKIRSEEAASESVRESIQELKLEINTGINSLDSLKSRESDAGESAENLFAEHDALCARIEELQNSKDELINEENELKMAEESNNIREDELSKKLEAERSLRQERLESISSMKLELAGINQRLEFVNENILRTGNELKELRTEREGLKPDEIISNIEKKRAEIELLKSESELLSAEIERLKISISENQSSRDVIFREHRKVFESIEELNQRIAALDKDMVRISAQKERAEDKLSALTGYIWNEYELSYADALSMKDESIYSRTDLKKSVENLKSDIRSLGSVNVNAIEEYKEVSERYELMRSQRQDIEEAERQLKNIIEELDAGMRKQFKENFANIAREFDIVFKELFGGGSGRLELDTEADILEAGISIIAQPPGKKLQNMMQLSGGEKALTAISLLFAIQNLKPSPFALLDEIEAALDDSNVDRFAAYLHKLTDRTQFIVITHRRGTMVSADRLYGITMQEKGVSTLVSVSLIEDKLS